MRIYNVQSCDTMFLGTGWPRNIRQQNVENLMNQKQSLLERKNELLSQTSERGGDKKSIQNILDAYEEQIKSLEQQISEEMMALPEKKEERPKTKKELEREKITDLVTLSTSYTQTKTVQSAQTQVEGQARVLEREIETDKGRFGDSEGLAKREEKLGQLKQRATKLASEIGAMAKEVMEDVKEEGGEREEDTPPVGSNEPTEQSDWPEKT